MDIIIVGGGKVGMTLTEQLIKENHNVTIVDIRPDRVQLAVNTYDAQGVEGNGASYVVQQEAGVESADLLIAVTNSDELNLFCCLIAKKAGGCPTIARVRNPIYYKEKEFIKEGLGLVSIMNPEFQAASEISRILRRRSVIDINPFAKGKVDIMSFKIPEGSVLDCMPLYNISMKLKCDVLIAAVERDNQVIIPDGNFALHSNDVVSLIATPVKAKEFFRKISMVSDSVRSCMIIGGGKNAYYLATQLINYGMEVKIIEKDRARCDELNILLPKAIIVHGDATDQELLLEEGLEYTDSFVTLTNMDEENIMLSLFASQNSNAKIITKINRLNFNSVIESLDLGTVIYPQHITAESILQYVRARHNSMGSSNVETLYKIVDDKAEALEFIITEESSVTGVPLTDLRIQKNVLLGCITRDGKAFIPRGKDTIQVGDSVIIVTTKTGMSKIQDILER